MVYASTSISNFRVEALVLAVVCQLVPALVGRNGIFVTRAPLCRVGAGGVACFTCSRGRGHRVLRRVNSRGRRVRHSGKLNRGRPSVVDLAAVGPRAHELVGMLPRSTRFADRVFSLLLNSGLRNEGGCVSRGNCLCVSSTSVSWYVVHGLE